MTAPVPVQKVSKMTQKESKRVKNDPKRVKKVSFLVVQKVTHFWVIYFIYTYALLTIKITSFLTQKSTKNGSFLTSFLTKKRSLFTSFWTPFLVQIVPNDPLKVSKKRVQKVTQKGHFLATFGTFGTLKNDPFLEGYLPCWPLPYP